MNSAFGSTKKTRERMVANDSAKMKSKESTIGRFSLAPGTDDDDVGSGGLEEEEEA